MTTRSSPFLVLSTSRALGWHDLLLERGLNPGGEFQCAPSEDNLVCLNAGAPLLIERGEDLDSTCRMQMPTGFATVVPAGQPALWRHHETIHHLHLHISSTLLDRTAEHLGLRCSGTLAGINPAPFHDPHVEQIVQLLRLEMESGVPQGTLYAETLASALSVRLLQREHNLVRLPASPPSAAKLRPELQRAMTFIQDNLAADLSLNTIAQEAGLSCYHFGRLFAEAFGVPPHQYVIQARIERAKTLITQGLLPLGQVAQNVGFSDQSHFTRHFKRLVGVTPRAFAHDTSPSATFFSKTVPEIPLIVQDSRLVAAV